MKSHPQNQVIWSPLCRWISHSFLSYNLVHDWPLVKRVKMDETLADKISLRPLFQKLGPLNRKSGTYLRSLSQEDYETLASETVIVASALNSTEHLVLLSLYIYMCWCVFSDVCFGASNRSYTGSTFSCHHRSSTSILAFCASFCRANETARRYAHKT